MTNTMIRATIDATITQEAIGADDGYTRLLKLTRSLSVAHPSLQNWFSLAHTKGGATISLADKPKFLADATENYSEQYKEFGFRAILSTAQSDKEWLQPGRALLTFEPSQGYIQLEIYDPINAHGETATNEIFQGSIKAIAQDEPVIFSGTDVNARLQSGKGIKMYMVENQLFPHRRWIGWMGFVPHSLEPRHIPEAAALISVGTKGTVIVAVDECFDLNNPDHLKRAHQVEARMAHIGLLDVTDSTLLS
ncbi:Imm52 family immunity protein [Xanthomonas oryzae]|uniref:Imm52 family immunity protein n=1 Tax=Xanthomonas oryzae pv. leersiae TaxID=3112258 RepID=A0AAJ6GUV3_9XANT|nr:Imm52 family immunity protein [Xanthomonas oryzae]WIX05052.1 Imm52 family immunity protein [Xanthomonas oryzae pv. oryzae]